MHEGISYDKSLSLRDIAQLTLGHRVLQYDDKVLSVNSFIANMIHWPAHPKLHPHPFAKLLRHCVAVFSYLIRKSNDVITSINIWFKQRILHSISNLFKGVYKLTLSTLIGRVKLDFFSLLRRLKYLPFK